MLTTVSCTGFTTGGSTNQFIMCTLPSASSTDDDGIAYNNNGNPYRFRLVGSSGNSVSSPSVIVASGNFGSTSSGGALDGSNFVRSPVIRVYTGQTVRGGDYVVNMPLTLEIRTSAQTFAMSSCSTGISAGIVTLSLPIIVRTSGPTCSINTMENVNFGDISVNAVGRVAAMKVTSSVEVACGGTDWTGTFSNGNNPSGSGPTLRRMVNGSSFLNYGFGRTSDSSAQINFSITSSSSSYTWDSTQYQTQRVSFSTFLPSQIPTSLTPGIYTDTVIFTVTW
ncbi:MAG: hypothetical protein EOP71_04720 [Variovorax sp.]|nr:MAG: hypothetical protein EOP71_04720 [Variovorax sp.]